MRPLLLVLMLLLAGCVRPATPEEPLVEASAPPPDPALEEVPSAPEPAEPVEEEVPTSREVVVEGSARAVLAVGLPCLGGVRPCARGPIEPGYLELPEGGSTGATLTVWWNATAPVAGNARVGVWREVEVAVGEGASPITIELPPEALGDADGLRVLFEPAVGSAFAMQEAHLVLVTRFG